MRTAQRLVKILIQAFLLVSLAAATSAGGQQRQPKNLESQTVISVAREIIETARYCALITLDSAGRARARTMDPFPPDENMVVWLGTNAKSRKVSEIRRNRRVTLYYFDQESQAYVAVYGIARLVNDVAAKAKHWKAGWEMFYPDRQKNFLLISVTPLKLEVVSEKKRILGDPRTWTPPSVTFRNFQRK